MRGIISEPAREAAMEDRGFQAEFVTMGQSTLVHRHSDIEILFILNGSARVTYDRQERILYPLDFIVIEGNRIHKVIFAPPQTMGICIHISMDYMKRYIPDIDLYHIVCPVADKTPEQEISEKLLMESMRDLTVLYVEHRPSYELRCCGRVMEILSELIDHFSTPVTEKLSVKSRNSISRLETICSYAKKHYKEQISLSDAAGEMGLNKEYFCRFFKKNMGISFGNYIIQLRLGHIYQDLIHTEDTVQELMERHGFFNQKLFYQKFKETYNCTPLQLRKMKSTGLYT